MKIHRSIDRSIVNEKEKTRTNRFSQMSDNHHYNHHDGDDRSISFNNFSFSHSSKKNDDDDKELKSGKKRFDC